MNRVAVVDVLPAAFSRNVTAQHQEQVRMSLERIVGRLALRTEAGGVAGVAEEVAEDDRSAVVVGRQQIVGPGEDGRVRRGVVLERDDDEVHPADAEQVVPVVVVRAVVAPVVGATREMRRAEVLVVEGRGAVGVAIRGLVVVPHAHAERQALGQTRGRGVLEHAQRGAGALPLDIVASVVAVLHAVAEVAGVDDVARHAVVHDPIGLGLEDRVRAAIELPGVVLGVGESDEREVRARARRGGTAVEGDRQAPAIRIRDRHVERRGGRHAGGMIRRSVEHRLWRLLVERQVERRAGDPRVAGAGHGSGHGGACRARDHRPGTLVEAPARHQPRLRQRELGVGGLLELGLRAREVPDPHLVELSVEEAVGCAGRRQGRRESRMLDAVGPHRLVDGQRGFQGAVQVELPRDAVVRHRAMVPPVPDRGEASHRVVLPGRGGSSALLEVGAQHAVGVANAEEEIHVDVAVLRLGGAVRDERDRIRNAAGARRGRGACPVPAEPAFDRELREVQRRRVAEGHIGVAREVEAGVGLGGSRGTGRTVGGGSPGAVHRAHPVAVLRRRREQHVRVAGRTRGHRGQQRVGAADSRRRPLDLETVLVARIVVPRQVDLAMGRGHRRESRWRRGSRERHVEGSAHHPGVVGTGHRPGHRRAGGTVDDRSRALVQAPAGGQPRLRRRDLAVGG